jgi:hypothetical protein
MHKLCDAICFLHDVWEGRASRGAHALQALTYASSTGKEFGKSVE